MSIHLGTSSRSFTFADLVRALPDKEFERDTRSTVALLAWSKDERRVAALARAVGAPPAGQTVARFEYPERAGCSACGGRGKPSFTDLLLDLGSDVLAIEAKRNERRYPTVKEWYAKSPTANRRAVLAHWLECCLRLPGPITRYHGLVYQMVHRAASARCAAGDRRGHVVHLLFNAEHADEYVEASKHAASLLAPSGDLRFHVVVVPTVPSHGNRERMSVSKLRNALIDQPLFDFGPPTQK